MDTHPVTTRTRRGSTLFRLLGATALVGLASWWGATTGHWWVAPAASAAAGLAVGRWLTPVLAALAVAGSWAVVLLAAGPGVLRVAEVAGSLAGFGPDSGIVVLGMTLVLAGILGLLPAWTGVTVHTLVGTALAARAAQTEAQPGAIAQGVAPTTGVPDPAPVASAV